MDFLLPGSRALISSVCLVPKGAPGLSGRPSLARRVDLRVLGRPRRNPATDDEP